MNKKTNLRVTTQAILKKTSQFRVTVRNNTLVVRVGESRKDVSKGSEVAVDFGGFFSSFSVDIRLIDALATSQINQIQLPNTSRRIRTIQIPPLDMNNHYSMRTRRIRVTISRPGPPGLFRFGDKVHGTLKVLNGGSDCV